MTARFAIGIDVGGTKIAAALVNTTTGALRDRQQLATMPERGGAAVLASVRACMATLTQAARVQGITVTATGIGICEIVDNGGRLRSAALIDWRDLDASVATDQTPPAHLVADVRAAALAEARLGQAKGVGHALFVSVGTGIASVPLVAGIPYAGAHGAALVMASAAKLGGDDLQTLEEFASGPGLARLYGEGADARRVIAAAAAGERRAVSLVAEAASRLGEAIGQLANCLDPEMIIIGGGLGSAPGPYFDHLKKHITDSLWSGVQRRVTIAQAALGADAGVIGAALAAVEGIH